MKRVLLICGVLFCAFTSIAHKENEGNKKSRTTTATGKNFPTLFKSHNATTAKMVDSIYKKINLASVGLDKEVFQQAYKGYQYLLSTAILKKTNILTIVDYSQSSARKRLYVIDLVNSQILYHLHVAHGKNSGEDYARNFSNKLNSNKSSLGFVITAETYNGSKGYSLRLDGVEKGFNDNVRMRDVVMHGSDYVNPQRAASGIMMGRSFGCPALSYTVSSDVINTIKNGSAMFLHYPDHTYLNTSNILNAEFEWPSLMAMNNSNKVAATVTTNDRL